MARQTVALEWTQSADWPGLARVRLGDEDIHARRLSPLDIALALIEARGRLPKTAVVISSRPVDWFVDRFAHGLSPRRLAALAERGEMRLAHPNGSDIIRVAWLPGHSLTLSHATRKEYTNPFGRVRLTWTTAAAVTIWDIGQLRLARPATWPAPLEDWYDDLRKRLKRQLGIAPKRHDGPGAIAAALLEAYGVRAHVGQQHPADRDAAMRAAYAGGRIEDFQIGLFPTLHGYDLNSAYPAAMAALPSLARGRWERVHQYEPDAAVSVWQVQWTIPPTATVAPFHYREARGSLLYPDTGVGWYWQPEVSLALKTYPGDINVFDGWVWRPDAGTELIRPFAWVRDVYHLRRHLAAAGDPLADALKLGLNACYGKLVQRPNPRFPASTGFRQPAWAGLMCSMVRAWVAGAALAAGPSLVAVSTDAVYATRPIAGLSIGPDLGQWRATGTMQDVLWVANGIYSAGVGITPSEQATTAIKTRGFTPADLDFAQLCDAWKTAGIGARVELTLNRTVNLQAAVKGGFGLERWHEPVAITETLSFGPAGRKVVQPWGQDALHNGRRGPVRLYPPTLRAGFPSSAAYRPEVHSPDARRLPKDRYLLPWAHG